MVIDEVCIAKAWFVYISNGLCPPIKPRVGTSCGSSPPLSLAGPPSVTQHFRRYAQKAIFEFTAFDMCNKLRIARINLVASRFCKVFAEV